MWRTNKDINMNWPIGFTVWNGNYETAQSHFIIKWNAVRNSNWLITMNQCEIGQATWLGQDSEHLNIGFTMVSPQNSENIRKYISSSLSQWVDRNHWCPAATLIFKCKCLMCLSIMYNENIV